MRVSHRPLIDQGARTVPTDQLQTKFSHHKAILCQTNIKIQEYELMSSPIDVEYEAYPAFEKLVSSHPLRTRRESEKDYNLP